MKTLILLATSAYLVLAASLIPAASEILAIHSHRETPKALILVDARCVATCLSEKARCASNCTPKTVAQTSQCEQRCRDTSNSCAYFNCIAPQAACISNCGYDRVGKTAQCAQSCGTEYIYCERRCAAN
jgi:hypothetical protein